MIVSAHTLSLRPKLTISAFPLNTDWDALQGQKVVAGGLADALAAASAAASGAAGHRGHSGAGGHCGHCGHASASQRHSHAGQAGGASGFALQPFPAHISSAAASLMLARVASCTCCTTVRALLELVATM